MAFQQSITRVELRPGEARWEEAVALKRRRAFAEVHEKTGLGLDRIAELYDTEARRNGLAFHDYMLRRDVADGALIGWLERDVLFAYANLTTSTFCASELTCGVVPDVCFAPSVSGDLRAEVFADLLCIAQESGVQVLQMTADGSEAEQLAAVGGALFKATYEWRLS
jgi:hypothetical protein